MKYLKTYRLFESISTSDFIVDALTVLGRYVTRPDIFSSDLEMWKDLDNKRGSLEWKGETDEEKEFKGRSNNTRLFDRMVHLLLYGHLPNKDEISRIKSLYETDDVCSSIIFFLGANKIDNKWEQGWEDVE